MPLIISRPLITLDKIDELTREVDYGSLGTQDDTMLQFSTPSVVSTKVRVTFPNDPTEGQIFGMTTVRELEDVELYSQYYPVVGIAEVTSLSPTSPWIWGFSIEIGKWVAHP